MCLACLLLVAASAASSGPAVRGRGERIAAARVAAAATMKLKKAVARLRVDLQTFRGFTGGFVMEKKSAATVFQRR